MDFLLQFMVSINMQKVATLVILLVGVLSCKAHDANSSAPTEGRSTTQSSASQNKEPSKQSVERIHSVVVNWSLVCEDLCGAGFGGPRCGKQCSNHGPSLNFNSKANGKYNSVDLCPVLCEFDLGGSKCDCGFDPKLMRSSIPITANSLCDIVCKRFKITIIGCSQCSIINPEQDRHQSETTLSPLPSKRTNSDYKETETTLIASTESPSPFTTIESTTSVDDHKATEPNWSEICKDFCNKGEGGSLCNCDLPPLSRANN